MVSVVPLLRLRGGHKTLPGLIRCLIRVPQLETKGPTGRTNQTALAGLPVRALYSGARGKHRTRRFRRGIGPTALPVVRYASMSQFNCTNLT